MERLERRRWIGVVCALVMGLCAAGQGKIIYVDDDAIRAGNGISWADAYIYLQDALANAANSSEPVEIRVGQGVYKPDRDLAHPDGTADREASFYLFEGVVLKGGFAGVGAVDPDARDIALYETVLSGDLAGDDVPVLDPCDLLTEPTRDDNSRAIVAAGPCSRATGLDGFTICSGNTTAPRASSGAGLYLSGDDIPSCPSVRNCTFSGHHGPSVYVHNGFPELLNCAFLWNAADAGAAILTNNLLVSPDYEFEIRRCTFADNYAKDSGGAIFTGYGDPSVMIEGCTFRRNVGARGGAVSVLVGRTVSADAGRRVNMVNCDLLHNKAQSGIVHIADYATVMITSCLFSHNVAEETGGAVYLRRAELNIASCTFFANQAQSGSAVASLLSWLYPELVSPPSVTIRNTILRNGGDEISVGEWAEIDVAFSNVQSGWPGIGNIDAEPLFAESGYWDSNDTPDDPSDDVWVDGDYHLKSQAGRWDQESENWVLDDVTSPCIDAGDPNSPLGDEPFPNGGVINMGAYGGTAEASLSYFGDRIPHWSQGLRPVQQE